MKPFCWILRQKIADKLHTYVGWDGPPTDAYTMVVKYSDIEKYLPEDVKVQFQNNALFPRITEAKEVSSGS